MNPGMYSSATPEWATPRGLLADLAERYGPFDLDPCATPESAAAPRFFTKADDGLSKPWTGRVFMNPPYGREIPRWVAKAWEESRANADIVVCLLPARTDTRWWHDHVMRVWPDGITFLRGRLRFGGAKNSAPFPSAVVVFRKDLL